MTLHEEALLTHNGEWFTLYAPLQGPKGFTRGWLANSQGTIITSLHNKYSCTEDLIQDAKAFLDTYSPAKFI